MRYFELTILDGREASVGYRTIEVWMKRVGPGLCRAFSTRRATFAKDSENRIIGCFQSECQLKYMKQRLLEVLPSLKTSNRWHVRYRMVEVDITAFGDLEIHIDDDLDELYSCTL